jgi:serine/threonine protein kinase
LWAALGARLEQFAGAWEAAAGPPDLAAFLPAGPPDVRRLHLVELIKFDLEARLRRGCARPLEEYVRAFPELAAGGPPADLLYEDYHLRRHAGAAPDPREYFDRFPDRADELARLLGGTAATRSTAAHAARAVVAVRAGEQLDDFALLTLLGEGQFARVFLARQQTMQRLVALKVSAARGAEAQTLAQLDHPHIVRVYDQRAVSARGLQLVYMAYLPGGTLADVLAHARTVPPGARSGRTLLAAVDAVLARRGETPPPDSPARRRWAERDWPAVVCALGARLAAALAYAHRHGVLHRDVKPANVLLTADGEPLLADFNVGCCTKLDGAGPAALFGGSLAYMAREHLEAFDPDHPRPADALDGRADVFGLAVTLWELAAGERPFGPGRVCPDRRETLAGLIAQRRRGPAPEAAAALADGSAPGLRSVLVACLDADPDRRPAAGDLERELELCLRPAARALVRAPACGWRGWVRRHPRLCVYPLAVLPNVLGSALNVEYNEAAIIAPWPGAGDVFQPIILAVNGLFFPLGMLGLWFVLLPVVRGLRHVRSAPEPAPAEPGRVRRRCLRLGELTAANCVACWAVAGVLWPIVLRAAAGPPPDAAAYGHLLLSLVICGCVASAFPYFLITYLAVTVLYPALLGWPAAGADDRAAFRHTERELTRFRSAATAIPLVAIVLLAYWGAPNRPAIAAMSVAGFAGMAVAYVLEGRIRTALTALADLPTGDHTSGG